MEDKNKLSMVSSEIAGIWSAYMSDSIASCVLKYFLKTVEDSDVKPHLQHALDLSTGHLEILAGFLSEEGIAIPQAFNDSDVNFAAPRLYTDTFMLFYLGTMCRAAMTAYSLAFNNVPREDIRNYFSSCIRETMDMYNETTATRLQIGTFMKPPKVEVSKTVSFIEKESFFSGIIGEPRPILTVEILHVFNCLMLNTLARTLVTGFGQVSSSEIVRKHMFEKVDTIAKHIETLNLSLSRDGIPIPSFSEAGVTDSTISPFSDKLMMFHSVTLLGNVMLSNYGTAIGSSFRSDLITSYIRFTAEIAHHAKNGTDIMIENKWLEQPPQAVNHKKLAKV